MKFLYSWGDFISYVLFSAFIIVGMTFIVVGMAGLLTYAYNTHIDNAPIRCIVGDKIVYEGISSKVKARTAGAATEIIIYEDVFNIKQKAKYVSSGIIIEPLEAE